MACNDGFIITLGLKDDNLMNLLRFFFTTLEITQPHSLPLTSAMLKCCIFKTSLLRLSCLG